MGHDATHLFKKVKKPRIAQKMLHITATIAELVIRLLETLLEVHAWAIARVEVENNRAAERFEQKISGIMMIEKEQGMSSLRPSSRPSLPGTLGNFVHQVISSYMRVRLMLIVFPCLTERTRDRLLEFVNNIKNAIMALTTSLLL